MITRQFALRDFIQVKTLNPKDVGWPTPSPFNMRFQNPGLSENQREAISGAGIYLILSTDSSEVIYLGLYRPMTGKIIEDRWGRHLQTITGRGFDIGLGGKTNPDRRRVELLAAIDAPGLRRAVDNSYTHSCADRFRDTGYCTTPNRLRFASEKWNTFETTSGVEILRGFAFCLFRIRNPKSCEIAKVEVEAMERQVLGQLQPVCNHQYSHMLHSKSRRHNTFPAFTQSIREAAGAVTGEDVSQLIQLST